MFVQAKRTPPTTHTELPPPRLHQQARPLPLAGLSIPRYSVCSLRRRRRRLEPTGHHRAPSERSSCTASNSRSPLHLPQIDLSDSSARPAICSGRHGRKVSWPADGDATRALVQLTPKRLLSSPCPAPFFFCPARLAPHRLAPAQSRLRACLQNFICARAPDHSRDLKPRSDTTWR
jgi:hypothetical protein